VTVVDAPPAVERRCPRCGADLRAEQEWCLSCGTGLGTRIAPTPRWRLPVALIALLAAVLVAALAVVIVQAADDADPVTQPPPAQPTPAPAAPTPAPTPAPATPPASGATAPADATLAEWPAGESGWTVIVAATPTREAAEARARELAAAGREVGVLEGDAYAPLRPGTWAVWLGRQPDRAAAQAALDGLGSEGEGAFVRRVRPRAGG